MEFLGAHDEVEVRHGGEERVPPRLRHAAQKAEDRFGTPLRHRPEHAHLAQRLLFGHVANTAGVEQDYVGVGFVGGPLVTAFQQRMRDLFRIAFVHLAAVGFDKELRHWERRILAQTGRTRQ